MADDAKIIQVLLVDDGQQELAALMVALELEDPNSDRFQVDQVPSTEEALDELMACAYDLVLVAERVGELDGVEVARDILLSGCRFPIVLITRRGDVALQRRALAAGVTDYVERGRYTTDLFERIIRHTRDFNELLELMRHTEACYAEAIRRGVSGEWRWEIQTRRIHFSPAFKAQLGYTASGMPETPEAWISRLLPSDVSRFKEAIRQILEEEHPRLDIELRVQHRDGHWLWMRVEGDLSEDAELGPVLGGQQTDMTAEKLADMRLEYVTNHDPLTGLLRRSVFVEKLGEHLREQTAGDADGLLCVCDIDGLKKVNLVHGRKAGDEVLLWLAGAVEDRVGRGGISSRLAGDKFGFLLPIQGVDQAQVILEEMHEELSSERFMTEHGEAFSVTAIWVVTDRLRDELAPVWLRRVEQCLFEAQRREAPVVVCPSRVRHPS